MGRAKSRANKTRFKGAKGPKGQKPFKGGNLKQLLNAEQDNNKSLRRKLEKKNGKKNQSPNGKKNRDGPPRKKQKVNANDTQKSKKKPDARSRKAKKLKKENDTTSHFTKAKNPSTCVEWLLSDQKGGSKSFFEKTFGSKSYHLKRRNPSYYNEASLKFQLQTVHQILEDNELNFGRHMIAKVCWSI